MDKIILHCDLNGFFASVEAIYQPELNDVPMAVCGDPQNRHGIILAKNEKAKAYDIKTTETVWQALKKCPNLKLVVPHHNRYGEYSKKVNEIYQRFTDLVEPFGIDESWLDVTESTKLFGTGEEIAYKIKETVKTELKLTISVGVSFNKIFAKLGSDYKKPDAVTVITRENYKEIIYPLPVSSLLYVGNSTAKKLNDLDIKTIGKLAECSRERLLKLFGKQGNELYLYANGLYDSPVKKYNEEDEIKSVGNGMTFNRNLVGLEDVKKGVMALSESVAARLRNYNAKCGAIKVTIKNPEFKTIDRQKKLDSPTNITKILYDEALEILINSWNLNEPIRLITITGINLTFGYEDEQLKLFELNNNMKNKKLEALDNSVDNIRKKYGNEILKKANIIKNDLGL
jgi:DNA polymerase-4